MCTPPIKGSSSANVRHSHGSESSFTSGRYSVVDGLGQASSLERASARAIAPNIIARTQALTHYRHLTSFLTVPNLSAVIQKDAPTGAEVLR